MSYTHFSIIERSKLELLLSQGASIRTQPSARQVGWVR